MNISNKVLWVLSGVIGAVFLIIVISLAVADKIKVGTLIVFIIIIILLIFIIDMTFWFIRKGKKISVEQEGKILKVIDLDSAKKIADDILRSTQYSEYEKERPFEDVWGMGETNTPIYVRISKGEFDKKYIAICVNMSDSTRRGSREHPSTIKMEDMLKELKVEANLVAAKPRPTPSQEEEVIERPGGEIVRRKRVITKKDVPELPEGGLK